MKIPDAGTSPTAGTAPAAAAANATPADATAAELALAVPKHGRRKPQNSTIGALQGAGAYLIWGVLPLYFVIVHPAGAFEIVASRVVASLIFCAILLSFARRWREFGALFKNARAIFMLALAAIFVAVNWTIYAYGVTSGQTLQASLGYFINPLFSVLLAVVVLKERLRPLQWVAIGIGLIAVIELSIAYGKLPWIALLLALSFGLYGLMKKKVGANLNALVSLSVETALLTPVALIVMAFMAAAGTLTTFGYGAGHFWLMAASGIVTAMPLLLFGAAARKLPLSTVGMLQFITPILQFLCAILFLGEQMPVSRWYGFGIVWVALIVLIVDMVRTSRSNRFRPAAA